jgi:ATP-binding cassette subfamily B protein
MSTATTSSVPLPNVSNLGIIKRLLKHMVPFSGIMVFSLLARIIKFVGQAALLGIAVSGVGLYVEGVEAGIVNWDIIWGQVKWLAIVGTVVGFASYMEHYTGHYVAFKILAAFRDKFYYAMLPLAPGRTSQLQSGEAVGRVMSDCTRIEPFYAHTIAPAIAAVVVPCILMSWLWTISETLVYVLAPFYIVNTVFLPWLVFKLGGDGVEYRHQLGKVNGFVADSIQGVRDTIAFGYEKKRAEELYAIGATMQAGQDKLYGADATQRGLAEIFITVGVLVSAWWGVELSLVGEINPLTELPAIIAVNLIGFYLSVGLANNFTSYRVSLIAARRLFAMMEQEPTVQETATKPVSGEVDSSIKFDNVCFEYDAEGSEWSRANKIFDGFSFELPKNKNFALVGPSGTGKSTVVNLLLRQWDPQSGTISLGGHPTTEFPLDDLQEYFAVVSQRSFIFNDTVRENIRMGNINASEEAILDVAEKAGLSEWLKASPDGLDTPCGERGSKISGGQRQRVAIARAMLKDAPFILLDEATSSLDVETEHSVMKALKKLMEGRTTLTIAHRLSTVVDSDEILVMLEGKIAERGAHQELIALGGWYAKMFVMQQDEVDATLTE